MKIAKIQWQKEVTLPWWVRVQSETMQKKYIAKKHPYTIVEGDEIVACVHGEKEDVEAELSQRNLQDLLWELEKIGVGVLMAPEDMILPKTRIQRVDGKMLRGLFAFFLAKNKLQERGISLGTAKYLVAGDWDLELVLAGMGQDVNYLSFFDVGEQRKLEELILAEYGLKIAEIPSVQSSLLAEMDVVLWCGLPNVKWAYFLKENTVFIDVFGVYQDDGLLGRMREDVLMVSDVVGIWKGEKMQLDLWEAVVYQNIREVRNLWKTGVDMMEMAKIFENLQEDFCGISSI